MGGLWSTVEDLGKWSHFLGSGFEPTYLQAPSQEEQAFDAVLSRASRVEMQRPHNAITPDVLFFSLPPFLLSLPFRLLFSSPQIFLVFSFLSL